MLVEGGPDYLAALHFCHLFDVHDLLPVAMLGKASIMPEALELLKGRQVRIYPHNDPNGGGLKASEQWARDLKAAGCAVKRFGFEGLRRRDGKPVNDLNDAALIHADDAEQLSSLLP
jgi:hypothetical protein